MVGKDDIIALRQQLLREINLPIIVNGLAEAEISRSSYSMEQPIVLQEQFLSWDLHHLLENVKLPFVNDSNNNACVEEVAKIQAEEPDHYQTILKSVDEMICNIVSAGVDPKQIGLQAHFCQLGSCETSINEQQIQQVLCAVAGLADVASAFEMPLKYSHHPFIQPDFSPCWLLISAKGILSYLQEKSEKNRGDWVYIAGLTKNELGRSEYALMKEITGGIFPKVDLVESKNLCKQVHQAIQKNLVSSCFSCGKGGLGVALAKMASNASYGIKVDLATVPVENVHSDTELLFSESTNRFVITVPSSKAKEFEECISAHPFGRIGVVIEEQEIAVTGLHGETILRFTDTFKYSEAESNLVER
jgi:phosphoribosylformylglycinamidine synthase subunit PurSL